MSMKSNSSKQSPTGHTAMTFRQWITEGKRRFGDDRMNWKFVCPSCGHIASTQDWKNAGAPQTAVAYSCIGRYIGDPNQAADAAFKNSGGPCNYTAGGLFNLTTLTIELDGTNHPMFAFADVTPE